MVDNLLMRILEMKIYFHRQIRIISERNDFILDQCVLWGFVDTSLHFLTLSLNTFFFNSINFFDAENTEIFWGFFWHFFCCNRRNYSIIASGCDIVATNCDKWPFNLLFPSLKMNAMRPPPAKPYHFLYLTVLPWNSFQYWWPWQLIFRQHCLILSLESFVKIILLCLHQQKACDCQLIL